MDTKLPSINLIDFFKSIEEPLTTAKTSNGINLNKNDDASAYNSLQLEISGKQLGSISLHVEGCMNVYDDERKELPDSECEWFPLVALNSKDFGVITDEIVEKGIYIIATNACSRIRIVVSSLSGSAVITGRLS